jgi:hypothetical protein
MHILPNILYIQGNFDKYAHSILLLKRYLFKFKFLEILIQVFENNRICHDVLL